jgi:hypothetical protein
MSANYLDLENPILLIRSNAKLLKDILLDSDHPDDGAIYLALQLEGHVAGLWQMFENGLANQRKSKAGAA